MIVVGLTGYKGSGKSTVADILVKDYGFTAMAFADPLKAMLRRLDPIIGHDLYAGCCNECFDQPEVTEVRMSDAAKFGFDDQSLKYSPWAEEVRALWERFGTEVFREEDPEYWVSLAERGLEKSTAERVVFTDVRFENEADMILGLQSRNIQSSLWRIARPGHEAGEHSAEQMAGLLGEAVTLINDGSLEDLESLVEQATDTITFGDDTPTPAPFNLDDLAREWGLTEGTE